MSEDRAKRLAQLKQAYENGILDEDTYRAAVAALGQSADYQAEVQSGAAAQGEGATAVGERGVNVGGDVEGPIITGDNVGDIFNNIGIALSRGAKATFNIFQNREQLRQQHDRQAMLDMVRQFWLDGVLDKSLYQGGQIELRLELRPEAVDSQTWDEIVQLPQGTAESIAVATTIGDIFYGMSALNRSLLILGAPGSGKTTMLLNLARQVLVKAEADPVQPIPVVFNLASWGVKRQPIADWLVDELNNKYIVPGKVGRPWVENDELLLLLDGLDEVETAHQLECVQAINQFQHEHRMPIVVCARNNEYELLPVRLQLHTAVFLHSLTLEQIDAYIYNVGGAELVSLSQWLQGDTRLQELVQTPLILNTMLQAYQGVSLSELESLETREARYHYLFAAYVQRMFHRGSPQQHFPREQTIPWLSWLAREMDRHSQAIFLIERLQPGWLASRGQRWLYLFLSRLAISLISGLLGGIILGLGFVVFFSETAGNGLMRGLSEGVLSCLIGGLAVVAIDGLWLESRGRLFPTATRYGQYGRLAVKILVWARPFI